MNKSEKLWEAFNHVEDEDLNFTDAFMKKPKARRGMVRTLLVAAVLASFFTLTAFAGAYINSPEQAWKVAKQEIEAMKELGILADTVTMPDEPNKVFTVEGKTGDDYWFGRIWKHRYAVSCRDSIYWFSMDVDTMSGKITRLSVEADGDENDTPTGKTVQIGDKTYQYYQNYYDIFPEEVTVDEYCTRLAEYWGFGGYTLAGTEDDFYDWDTEAPSGGMKMMDISEEVYLTVYFEGDQSGVPMYIQRGQLPGRVYFSVGTNHQVG